MSAGNIRFHKAMDFKYRVADQVTPLIRRMVAENPSPYTFHGTNGYIVGHGQVAVIDPGPLLESHIEALAAALEGEVVSHILVTHTHHDHSPAAKPLRELTGGVIAGALPRPIPDGATTAESIHRNFDPDQVIADGDIFAGEGWSLEAVYTPGHISNHMCFALKQENILFTGDHIMGWNTTVVSPPDGNMAEYMASLERCLERTDSAYWPGHGPVIPDPGPFVRAYRGHRLMREAEIIKSLQAGDETIGEMVLRMYRHIPETMHHAAARSVLAHLELMAEDGRVATDGAVTPDAVYRVNN
jgi:glyoxylase-like metal-dependent hydrolase (beta-lactamase superfamily II)